MAAFRANFRARIEAPVAAIFVRTHLTPNMLTLIGFGIAVVAAIASAGLAYMWAGLLVAFGAGFDLFDGALARATGKTSKFGAFLDSTFDRAGEAVVYVGIAYGAATYDWRWATVLAITALAASFMVSYTRAKSESMGFSSGTGMANIGIAPREVRIVILAFGLIFTDLAGGVLNIPPESFDSVSLSGRPWLIGALALIAILATVTAIQRILFVYRQSQSTN